VGARVRVRLDGNALPEFRGCIGTVREHLDGSAFWMAPDELAQLAWVLCDPSDVELLAAPGVPREAPDA